MNLVHTGITLLSLTGWWWWPQHAITWYVVGVAAIGVQWAVSGNRCVLTDLEWWLKYNTSWQPGETEGFIAAWARRVGFEWPPRVNLWVPWVGLVSCLSLGCLRLVG